MKIKIIDLTDYTMPEFEGYQSFNIQDCYRVFDKCIPKKLKNDYEIVKDKMPSWNCPGWVQTWSIQKK